MGAWGAGSFENDDAMDWLGEFADRPDIETISNAFNQVIDLSDDYVEAPEGSCSIAAAEVLTGILEKLSPEFPEQYVRTINFTSLKSSGLDKLRKNALDAIKIVRDSKNSELKDLWEDSKSYDEWKNKMTDLETRLAS